MSADLFAEFNDLANTPPPPPQQQQSLTSTPFQSFAPQQPQNTTGPVDLFGFPPTSNIPALAKPPSSLHTQQSDPFSSCGQPVGHQKPSTTAVAVEDDDGWGDFEVASPVVPPPPPTTGSSAFPQASSLWQAPAAGSAASQNPPESVGIKRTPTFDIVTNNLVALDNNHHSRLGTQNKSAEPLWEQPQSHTAESKPTWKLPQDPNVLFDADDFELQGGDDDEDDEEFGDFETVDPVASPPKPSATRAPQPLPSMDLLSLDEPAQPPQQSQPTPPPPKQTKAPPSQLLGGLAFGASTPYPQAPKSPSFQDRNPFPELGVKINKTPIPQQTGKEPKSATPVTAWPNYDERLDLNGETYKDDVDEWGAWDDGPDNSATKAGESKISQPRDSWDWDATDSTKPSGRATSNNDEDVPPPTNVPPPSVILSIFPELLNSGSALFKPLTGQNTSIKERIVSDPKAVDFLQAYILIATTAARVIAGRKQRWHRDKILAKSMSISAAGSKGMKLAGIDKTQSAREDREAADVVATWRLQVGRLRSAVAAAKVAGKATLKVPELNETMQVQTAKMVPTAPKPCIICGLKREERVSKVDFDVEDSFGEWWAEHWGHKACKNFWLEHEESLRSR